MSGGGRAARHPSIVARADRWRARSRAGLVDADHVEHRYLRLRRHDVAHDQLRARHTTLLRELDRSLAVDGLGVVVDEQQVHSRRLHALQGLVDRLVGADGPRLDLEEVGEHRHGGIVELDPVERPCRTPEGGGGLEWNRVTGPVLARHRAYPSRSPRSVCSYRQRRARDAPRASRRYPQVPDPVRQPRVARNTRLPCNFIQALWPHESGIRLSTSRQLG